MVVCDVHGKYVSSEWTIELAFTPTSACISLFEISIYGPENLQVQSLRGLLKCLSFGSAYSYTVMNHNCHVARSPLRHFGHIVFCLFQYGTVQIHPFPLVYNATATVVNADKKDAIYSRDSGFIPVCYWDCWGLLLVELCSCCSCWAIPCLCLCCRNSDMLFVCFTAGNW